MSNRSPATITTKEKSSMPMRSSLIQRQCACGNSAGMAGECSDCQKKSLVQRKSIDRDNTSEEPPIAHEFPIQTKLTVGKPGDIYEQEADRVADRVMQMPATSIQRQTDLEEVEGIVRRKILTKRATPLVQRQISPKIAETDVIQTKATNNQTFASASTQSSSEVPSSVHEALSSPGKPLDPITRAFMEPRFGHDFSIVRVHSGAVAERSSKDIDAHAYTVGYNMVFGSGQFVPGTPEGRWLIAHELTHVIQQEALPTMVAQRQTSPIDDADDMMERKYADDNVAPKAKSCGRPSHCPIGFCQTYRSEKLAKYYLSSRGPWVLARIADVVDSRVVPFWNDYLSGGSAPKNITIDFAKDFTNSRTTKKTTDFLTDELKKRLSATPPAITSKASIDISTLIPQAIAELDDPVSAKRMNFSFPRDIPGNLAGDIGKDQTACQTGAKPSPFNDERRASGTVELVRKSSSDIVVTPSITYAVKDTVDLCPGDCGSFLESLATVTLSQFEATGIAGDVPFTVEFPAPLTGAFTISGPLPTIVPILPSTLPVSEPKKPLK